MGDGLLARVLLKQATEMTARCAAVIFSEYLAGAEIADLAERYGLDESTILWWCGIGSLKRPNDAPKTFASPTPSVLKGFESVYG